MYLNQINVFPTKSLNKTNHFRTLGNVTPMSKLSYISHLNRNMFIMPGIFINHNNRLSQFLNVTCNFYHIIEYFY